MTSRETLKRRIEDLIDGPPNEAKRDTLIEDLAQYQRKRIEPYARLDWSRSIPPALPTDVFRFARVATHPATDDVRRFETSGTGAAEKGIHAFADLHLYDKAAYREAQRMLFPDQARMSLIMLAPHEREAPRSSLSYMLSRFEEWFGLSCLWAWRDGALDFDAIVLGLRTACAQGSPVALLGTSFAFVHAEDTFGSTRFALPKGSRLMQTGGFKGRSREVGPAELQRSLCSRYGLADSMVIAEYGMTELSSQLYETTLRDQLTAVPSIERSFCVPHWVRATPVDPESLEPLPVGEVGLLRLDDCANLDSVACIQTSDLARRTEIGIELIGRASEAVARGCSLSADVALERSLST